MNASRFGARALTQRKTGLRPSKVRFLRANRTADSTLAPEKMSRGRRQTSNSSQVSFKWARDARSRGAVNQDAGTMHARKPSSASRSTAPRRNSEAFSVRLPFLDCHGGLDTTRLGRIPRFPCSAKKDKPYLPLTVFKPCQRKSITYWLISPH